MAIGGSAGQAAGLVLGKHGAGSLDAFAATEIRVLAGMAGFLILALATKTLPEIGRLLAMALSSPRPGHEQRIRFVRSALLTVALGSLLGPFLGVSLGLLSAQHLPTGIASTLMSTVPVLLIPVSVVVFHERVTAIEIVGTIVAIMGVALLV